MKRPVILVIEWEDPTSHIGWMSEDDAKEKRPAEIVSCGMLFNETNKYLRLALDWGKDGEVNTLGVYNRAIITKRKELKLPRGIWKELPEEMKVTPKTTVTVHGRRKQKPEQAEPEKEEG